MFYSDLYHFPNFLNVSVYIYEFYYLKPKNKAIARVHSKPGRKEEVTKAVNSADCPVCIYSILLTPELVMTSK